MVLLKAAEDAEAGRLNDFTKGRSVAVNYDVEVRRHRSDRFTLITRADIQEKGISSEDGNN